MYTRRAQIERAMPNGFVTISILEPTKSFLLGLTSTPGRRPVDMPNGRVVVSRRPTNAERL